MAAVDNLSVSTGHLSADSAAAVTPSDSVELTNVSRAIFVGGAGNLRVLMAGGQTVTFTGVLAGALLPIRVRQVLSTSTTATSITAIW